MGALFGLLSAFFGGTEAFFASKTSKKIHYTVNLFWMLIISSCILFICFLVAIPQLNFVNLSSSLPPLIIIGIFQTIAYLAYFRAYSRGNASIVTPIVGSYSLIVVFLSIIFIGEVLEEYEFLAIALIVTGLISLSFDVKGLIKSRKVLVQDGARSAGIAMIAYGISYFLIAFVTKDLGWFLTTFLHRLFTLFFFLVFLFFYRKSKITIPSKNHFSIFILIALLDIGAFFTYSIGITFAKASIVAPLAASAPLITTVLAVLFLNEKLTFIQFIGALSVIFGIIAMSI